ncbi:hypothetical protein SAMN05421848_2085 [Kushneria avicenniae]|uniref:Uncharacterized protein n=1 Tax=Kushneria avicenniae TaxID=402385 RepID=A0A1I1KU20_9GAMM|nr:hypothetical protein [Kushneria avicenniae]SFC62218.1 hypothetical protein SAMN05421848_2085 [Kushneria avicenniae]
MQTLWMDWLFIAGLILLPVGAGMVIMGIYVRTFRAVLVGVGLLLVAAVILLAGP